jgi:hypothetical protein
LLQVPPLPQSLLRLHWTQVLLLHTGVDPPQSLLLMHDPPPPGIPPVVVQTFVVKLHVPPVPQSRSLKHWTQAPSPEQSGAFESLQSAATPHSTHCPPALQMCFIGSVQSEAPRHWTHMLCVVSQSGVAPLHAELALQLLVHWRAEELHTMPFVQSVDARQGTQRPSVASQTGFGAAHPVAQLGPPTPAAPPFDVPALDAPAFDAPPLADAPPFPDVFPATPAPPSLFMPDVLELSLPPHAATTTTATDRANTDAIPARRETRDMGTPLLG